MAYRGFDKAKTTVFWDVEDFPMRADLFYEKIKSALEKEGCHGEVSVNAYGEKKPQGMNLDDDGVFINFVDINDKYWRLNKMVLDIGWWAMENPNPSINPRNLMVIAKNLETETEFGYLLEHLWSLGYNVLLALPSDSNPKKVKVPRVDKAWYWKDLVEGGNPIDDIMPIAQQFLNDNWMVKVPEEEVTEIDYGVCKFCSGKERHNLDRNLETLSLDSDCDVKNEPMCV